MGYRSQVAFVLSVDEYDEKVPKDVEIFKGLVGFFKLSDFYSVATSPDYDLLNPKKTDGDGIGWKDGCVLFNAEDWKWYDGYDIVEAYKKLWKQMQGLEGISGYFCRVGEERGDIDEQEFGDDPNYDYFRPYSYLQFDDTIIGEYEVEKEQTTKAQANTKEESCCGFATCQPKAQYWKAQEQEA